ncbi:MAG: prolipoprotein diacylglyceryl transferase [Defluviitaleaceae bacterium]|nr:prolipoprotein diacylglyceryl transferase [Defluviitaleaceae bacterium]
MADIIFPNLGITIQNLNRVAFSIGTFDIYWYAVFVVTGILAGVFFGAYFAPKKTGQNHEIYFDFALWVIPSAIVGGRLFFLMFSPWPEGAGIGHLFNIRAGGIAIFGVIIAALATAIIFCWRKKISFFNFADTAVVGLIIGHVIGRFGNFTNREAFGGFAPDTAPFAMQLRMQPEPTVLSTGNVTQQMWDNQVFHNGIAYIQVHPVFFYEAAINLALFVFLNLYRKHKKFNGELIAMYFLSYGITRFFLETMRTDQLHIGGTGIAIAHLLSASLIGVGGFILARGYINYFKNRKSAA